MNDSYQSGNYTPTITDSAEDFLKLDELASEMYHEYKTMTNDVAEIAANTNWDVADIEKIKHHIFTKEGLLDNGYGNFPPDYEMALAWQRVINGSCFDCDILLLNHELYELTYYDMYHSALGITQQTAHDAAQAVFNWIEALRQPGYNA